MNKNIYTMTQQVAIFPFHLNMFTFAVHATRAFNTVKDYLDIWKK